MHKWLVLGLLIWALGEVHMSVGMDAQHGNYRGRVRYECSFTGYPDLCVETLLGLQLRHPNVDLVSALVEKTRDETKLPIPNLPSYQLESQNTQHPQVTIGYCIELMNMSLKRLNQSLIAFRNSRSQSKEDIQTWLSAVLTFQETCKDSVKDLSGSLVGQISERMNYLSRLASNSLALVNRNFRIPNITTSRRLTSEEVFPEWVSSKERKLLQSTEIKANVVVAKDGSGNYMTISEAIKAAYGGRFVIYVKSGIYKEKIRTNKDGITLIGDGKYSTIIVGDDSLAGGSTLPDSATFAITGDGFIARDIGFQNTAGPQGQQAVALSIVSDRSVLYKCSIAGYQDTLYALALRQFYRECDIYGTVDFIFGNAAAVFQSCNLVLRRPESRRAYNVILANGRSDPRQNTGFSVHNCKIMPASDFSSVKHSFNSYLGRPWKDYSRTVVMQSTIDDAITPRGWIEWSGNFALKTLYFAEYLNAGPGAATSQRVRWPGYHVIGSQEASQFTVAKFIAGTSWLPSTGVNFVSGLN